jgi:hypothetical protein
MEKVVPCDRELLEGFSGCDALARVIDINLCLR